MTIHLPCKRKRTEAEAVRELKRKQLNDFSLVKWGNSFTSERSGAIRHEILPARNFVTRGEQI